MAVRPSKSLSHHWSPPPLHFRHSYDQVTIPKGSTTTRLLVKWWYQWWWPGLLSDIAQSMHIKRINFNEVMKSLTKVFSENPALKLSDDKTTDVKNWSVWLCRFFTMTKIKIHRYQSVLQKICYTKPQVISCFANEMIVTPRIFKQ